MKSSTATNRISTTEGTESTEVLFECPECNRKNFTRAGLLHHVCKGKGNDSPSVNSVLSVVKSTPPAVVESDYEQMGAQLTAQYRLAVDGARHVVKFGAMCVQIREELASDSTRGVAPKSGSRDSKGMGLKGWLAKFAPSVPEATAHRYMDVAEAVLELSKLPSSIKKDPAQFVKFLQASPEELDEKLRPKQLMLWEEVDGNSQRSWLDRFKAKKSRGGDTSKHSKPGDSSPVVSEITQITDLLLTCGQKLNEEFFVNAKKARVPQWTLLPDDARDRLQEWLKEMSAAISEAKKCASRTGIKGA